MKRILQTFVAALALAVLSACAQFAVPSPKTFEDNLAVGLSTNTRVRLVTDALYKAKKISRADAIDVQAQCDTARVSIDLARDIYSSDQAAGQAKLTVAVATLKALDAYLAKKGTSP